MVCSAEAFIKRFLSGILCLDLSKAMAFEAQPDIGGTCGAGGRRLQRDGRRVPSQGGLEECLELSSSFKRFTAQSLSLRACHEVDDLKKARCSETSPD